MQTYVHDAFQHLSWQPCHASMKRSEDFWYVLFVPISSTFTWNIGCNLNESKCHKSVTQVNRRDSVGTFSVTFHMLFISRSLHLQ